MNIGIIGAGNIGSTLGKKWSATGHTVHYGVRSPSNEKYADLHVYGKVVSIEEAVTFADVIVLAVPGTAVAEFIDEHSETLAGKLIVDATNNPRGAQMNGLSLLSQKVPAARLARAFSTLGWESIETPHRDDVQLDLFYCAQPSARADLEPLITTVGLRPVYVGDIDMADALDGMTRVWFALAFGQGMGRKITFKLLG
jgi:8-hydroxy-5-deazaflavin:NADPH oxidoreductase